MKELHIQVDTEKLEVRVNYMALHFNSLNELRIFIQDLTKDHLKNFFLWGE